MAWIKLFHYDVFRRMPKGAIFDMSTIFDKYYDDVPVGDVFVDEVHLFDTGNKIIAKEILVLIENGKVRDRE